jgi:hypothetical protein
MLPQLIYAQNCPTNTHFVRSHIRSGVAVRAYCRVNPEGFKNWHQFLKSGRPKNWPTKNEESSDWKKHEVEQLIHLIDDLPNFLISLEIEGIYRLKKSAQYPNPGANHQGSIVLYDNAYNNKEDLKKTIIHELAHSLYDSLSEKQKSDYNHSLGWSNLSLDSEIVWIGRKNGYVEGDGSLNPDEDFSNNIEYFLTNSKKLQEVTPKAFEWISKNLGKDLIK